MKIDEIIKLIENANYKKQVEELKGNIFKISELDANKENLSGTGVYLIMEADNNIIYIGSAYSRSVYERIKQYTGKSRTGNTLANNLMHNELYPEGSNDLEEEKKTDKQLKEIFDKKVEHIRTLRFIFIPHTDLEYYLIKNTEGLINKRGNK
jgi:hypothetical protein